MAEKSILWDTNATGDGTGTGYTETDMIQLFRSLFTRTSNMGGVVPDFLNELAVSGTSSPVAVNTGAGLCYGIPYWNTASVNVTIATPAVSTRVDRIVLRADWTAQTVRITRIAGTEGAGAPAMTQSAGTTWDVPLATVSITTGGVITVTDAREWLLGTGDLTIDSTKLATDAVTTAKITDANVTAAKLASDSVTTAKILDGNVTSAKIADSNITNAKMADNAINTAEIVDGAVTAAKLAVGAAAAASHTHDPRTDLAGTNGVIADSANGNARGTDAVDLQTIRTNASEVASGASAVVAGGRRNTASAAYSAVVGGYGAIARLHGQEAFAAGFYLNPGDLQRSIYTVWGAFGGGGGSLYLDGASLSITVPTNATIAFDAFIVGRCPTDDKSSAYRITGLASDSGGTVALVGSLNKTVIAEGDAGDDATVYVGAGIIEVQVTAHAINTYWVASIHTVEVSVGS